jgi:uncharacterized protein DUF4258
VRAFEGVKGAILRGAVVVSRHAVLELEEDGLDLDALLMETCSGEVIEDYPTDPRGPSCLVCSVLEPGVWVHTVWGWDAVGEIAVLITAYRPTQEKWNEDFKTRKH